MSEKDQETNQEDLLEDQDNQEAEALVEDGTQQTDMADEIDWQDKYLRAQAEIQNMQARNSKERSQLLQYDGQKLAVAILPVVDNLERALEVKTNSEDAEQIKKGVQQTLTSLQNALNDYQVVAFGVAGEAFNPEQHQAIQQADGGQKDTIAQVLQKGYQFKDRILRPAMVSVYQGGEN